MIRKGGDGRFKVECSHCKQVAGFAGKDEVEALQKAEEGCGFAVIGKFQYCPSCFADMLERWKHHNQEAIRPEPNMK